MINDVPWRITSVGRTVEIANKVGNRRVSSQVSAERRDAYTFLFQIFKFRPNVFQVWIERRGGAEQIWNRDAVDDLVLVDEDLNRVEVDGELNSAIAHWNMKMKDEVGHFSSSLRELWTFSQDEFLIPVFKIDKKRLAEIEAFN